MFTLKVALSTVLVVASLVVASPHPASTTPAGTRWVVEKLFEPKSPVPAAQDLEVCVRTAAQKLGIDFKASVDTKLLNEILEKDMHLAGMPRIKQLFAADLTAAQPMAPLLNQLLKGFTQQHPLLGTTVCTALEDASTTVLFAKPNTAMIKRSLHHMFLLDKIVQALEDDVSFMEEIREYLHKEVDKLVGSDSKFKHTVEMFKAAGVFGIAKEYTINLAFDNFIKLRKQSSISQSEQDDRKKNLVVNIGEAGAVDGAHGYIPNVKVAWALGAQRPTKVWLEGEKKVLRYGLNTDWARLYEGWNLAFITANLEHLNILYPKLLTPRVLLANGPRFLYARGIALWLSINFYLMAYLTKTPNPDFEGRKALATLMGKINLRYSNYVNLAAPFEE